MIPVRGQVRGTQETISAMSQIPSLLVQAGIGAMTESLQLASKTVREKFLRGPYPSEIQSRSGSFSATFSRGHPKNIWEVESKANVITGRFGSNDIRARVLEEGTSYLPGGVIRPKRGQFLAIPTENALTPSTGQFRAQYAAAKQSWRNVGNTFVGHSRRGGLFIAERALGGGGRRGRRGRLKILAWLVRQVRIAGRHYMQKTQAVIEPMLPPIFERRLNEPLKRLQQTLSRLRGR